MPAQAGIGSSCTQFWIPAFAGMTRVEHRRTLHSTEVFQFLDVSRSGVAVILVAVIDSPQMTRPTHSSIRPGNLVLRAVGLVWLTLFTIWFFSLTLPNGRLNDGTPISRPDIWISLPELLWQNVQAPEGVDSSSSGWRFAVQRLDLIGVAAFILLSAASGGHLLLRLIGVRVSLDQLERTTLACGLGLSALSLLTLGLGTLGLLDRWLFLVVMGSVLAVEAACHCRKWRLANKTSPPEKSEHSRRSGRLSSPAICLFATAPFLLAMLLGAMLPSTDFDVKEYHLQGPKEYFQDGRISFLPHNVYTSFPFLTEMLSLLAMVLRGDWFRGALAGKAVLMSFAPLTAVGLYAAGRRWFGATIGWLAALVYLTTPWVYRISVIAYAEGGLTFFLSVTLLAVMLAADSAADAQKFTRRVFLSGLLAGSAVACKYPGLVSVTIPMGLALMLLSGVRPKATGIARVKIALRTGLVFAAGALVTFGPWMLKNLVETGNPVYPLLYSVFGGADWDESLNARWRAAHSPPVHLLDSPSLIGVDLKERFFDVVARSDWQSPLLFAPALLALFAPVRRRWVWALWLYVAWLFITWWGLTHRIDRFWVPLLPVLSLLCAVGLGWLLGVTWNLPGRGPSRATDAGTHQGGSRVSTLIASGTVLLMATVMLFQLAFVTTRLCGYNSYLIDLNVARKEVTTQSIRLLEELPLPPRCRVLFVGEAEVFDALFEHVYNTVFDRSLFVHWTTEGASGDADDQAAWRTPEAIRETFHDQSITHVFVNWQEILRYRRTYGFTSFVTPARFAELVKAQLLAPLPLDSKQTLRPMDSLSPAEQDEIRTWAPELIVPVSGQPAFIKYSLFRVQ